MLPTNCATGTLAPFEPSAEQIWDRRRVQHLFRRMGYGATPEEVEAALLQSPADLVDTLIENAGTLPLPEEPEWAFWDTDDYPGDFFEIRQQQFIDWTLAWVRDMLEKGFREKLALFWHNHFVTRFEVYQCPSHQYQYHRLLQQYALGNFRTFVKAIGKTPAMLVFLNGVQNNRFQPNENYARELFELFTLGRDNGYTQEDITQAARALTGWVGYQRPFCGAISFVEAFFDGGVKTVFGQTGNWDYDQLHDILFAERGEQIARYICGKIYSHFVHPEPAGDIVSGLAETFLANDFELAPVFRQLFRSEHFFDEHIIGAQVKSPVDCFLSFIRDGNFFYDQQIIQGVGFQAYALGQQLFNPPDVAGWPGNRSWIDANTLTGRWQTLLYFILFTYERAPERLSQLALQLSGEVATDPALVTRAVVDYFLPNGLQYAGDYERATEAFKWEVPQNYFDRGEWNLNWDTVPAQMVSLLYHLIRLPEFQLA